MLHKIGIAGLAIGALTLGFARPGVIVSIAYAQESSQVRTIKADGLSKVELRKRFATLPNSALVELKGKRATAGEISQEDAAVGQRCRGDCKARCQPSEDGKREDLRRGRSAPGPIPGAPAVKLAEARAKAMAEFDREGATEKSKQKAR